MLQFNKFCLVGGAGFVVDALAFALFLFVLNEPFPARALAFWAALNATWLGNRLFTFHHSPCENPLRQWGKHVLSAHLSGALNLLCFWTLLSMTHLSVAFVIGIVVGLICNYLLSSRFVFVKA